MSIEPEYGSDVMVDLLVQMGVEIIPFAPGATFRGIHDSLLHRDDAPEIIECLHEEISVAVAHGYAKARGTMAVAALHDVVGLQHATMAIYNAWCDRVPLLLLGGTGPVDAARRRPWIDWIHTANVQGNQVRDYTKWDDQPASLEAVPESFVRGRQLATSAPPGPVYLCLDSEIQEQRVPGGFRSVDVSAYPAARPLSPDPDTVEEIATALVNARQPLIAVEGVDRRQRGLELLVELAELLGAAVMEVQRDYNRTALCMPTAHGHNATGMGLALAPDVVLALDVRDLHVVPGVEGADVYQVSTAGLAAKAWAADLQRVQTARALVAAEVTPVLEQLLPRIRKLLAVDAAAQAVARERGSALVAQTASVRARWEAEARADGDGDVITPAFLAQAIDDETRGIDRVLANGSLHNWVHRLWSIDRVDDYLGSSGGAGLGYGLGASIGAGLAHRETGRLVIDIQSDGDAMMTPGALWTAAKHRVPLLIVLENNRKWGNSFVHAGLIARSRTRSETRMGVGTVIDDPAIDFVALASSMGITDSWRVDRPGDLHAALRRGIRVVREERRPVVIDVRTT
ncbi:thiamine pyrophosphate-binding protein [Microbacterium sp. MYb62]|uniref:thiamine pyrophosphate-binding protein n=1 Tax=Microbacterium sp. MYb62 TaxID=1848690 RepID=UPI000CFB4116|nr:thiamine pyrophosphate-dependent enzyme [Microbacterium sp. MYb62]PRB18410.1 thiamine pyrophosphate-binding protein [Microbacterium sp. MYb62]